MHIPDSYYLTFVVLLSFYIAFVGANAKTHSLYAAHLLMKLMNIYKLIVF